MIKLIKSELSILMAQKKIRRLNYLQEQTNLSWDVFNKLMNDENISTIRLGNLVKICNVLNCKINDLVVIKYPYKPINLVNKSHGPSNLKLLMSINDIDTINELMRRASISWGVTKKIQDGHYDSIELNSLVQVCFALNCKLEDLLNISYNWAEEGF